MRIAVFALLLAGCSSAAQNAESRYAMVAANGTAADKCRAAKDVENEYLKALDRQKYRDWHVRMLLDCNRADLDRL